MYACARLCCRQVGHQTIAQPYSSGKQRLQSLTAPNTTGNERDGADLAAQLKSVQACHSATCLRWHAVGHGAHGKLCTRLFMMQGLQGAREGRTASQLGMCAMAQPYLARARHLGEATDSVDAVTFIMLPAGIYIVKLV